jgi:hypothetical protein
MVSARVSYTTRPHTAPEEERAALQNVYKFVIDRAMKNAAHMSSTKSTRVRYTEGVGDVERHPD